MDAKEKNRICLAAAVAANCIPCFELYLGRAREAGIADEEVAEIVELASKVKKGAHIVLQDRINNLLRKPGGTGSGTCAPTGSCCG